MDAASLSSLLADLFMAIHLLAGYSLPADYPEIHRVPQQVIQERFCRARCGIKAVYDPALGVYIDETLDFEKNLFARSILLHELVHHVQAVSGRFNADPSDCERRNRSEEEAYRIQNRYLASVNDYHHVIYPAWSLTCRE